MARWGGESKMWPTARGPVYRTKFEVKYVLLAKDFEMRI